MDDQENSLFQARKAKRIEQMVARWLRRSRDNLPRSRVSVTDCSSGSQQFTSPVKVTTVIHKDLFLGGYGFDISQDHPVTIISVTAGGPADGKLAPGDQILRINNEAVEEMPVDQVADVIRLLEESLPITILRYPAGPKSSFLTAEKRARLKCNPAKVRFAEEVIVNGHAQGNSLLFMPNVLKVYLENGQTKAFKFEKKTTVKDIILTLKEKLSINSIEHFALALEEQYNISKLYLLHEDELIEQVVQKRESHDYRCLFRVCFVPRDPWDLLQEDPVAFEYLYLQSCSDVLQERYAVEMKCSVALRLAALHIQERIFSCAQPQKISMKYIEKDWGIENFISPTLLRNMRGKDIKKAINFHMKRNQALLEPRQKQPLSAAQVRLNYLKILGELKTYGGKIFNATLLLQDRESYISLLVGAKYGISQIVNNKLNIMTTLAEFANISRMELTSESEKISMMKVYVQDVKPLTLLLESNSAKDLACLISGYYKLFIDSGNAIFTWNSERQVHRISAEEGYESRICSDSEESSEFDSSMEFSSDFHHLKYSVVKPLHEEEEEEEEEEFADRLELEGNEPEEGIGEMLPCDGSNIGTDSASEASDSATTESKGCKISWSSDSIDALEEDDLETCSSSRPEFFQFYTPCLKHMDSDYTNVFSTEGSEMQAETENGKAGFDPLLCFLQNSPAPNDRAAEQQESTQCLAEAEQKEDNEMNTFTLGCRLYDNNIMEYYSLCSNVSPASSMERNILSSTGSCSSTDMLDDCEQENTLGKKRPAAEVESLILSPPPGFGDSSSEEEFFDAAERLTPTHLSAGSNIISNGEKFKFNFQISGSCTNLVDNFMSRTDKIERRRLGAESGWSTNASRKRRSFLQTDYTSQVTFPLGSSYSLQNVDHVCCYERESYLASIPHSQTVSSLKDTEGEPALMETKPLNQIQPNQKDKRKSPSPSLMEMEPDTMETKSVTDTIISSISAIRFRSEQEPVAVDSNVPSRRNSKQNTIISDLPSLSDKGGRISPSEVYFRLEEDNDETCGLLKSCPSYSTEISVTSEMSGIEYEPASGGNSGSESREADEAFESGCKDKSLRFSAELARDSPEGHASEQSAYVVISAEKCISSDGENEEGAKCSSSQGGTLDVMHCTANSESVLTSREINGHDVNEGVIQMDGCHKSVGFSNATNLLFDLNSISGILTRFSMSLFKEKSGDAVPCHSSGTQFTMEGEKLGVIPEKHSQVQDGCMSREDQMYPDAAEGYSCSLALKPIENILNPSQLGDKFGSVEKDRSEDLVQTQCGLVLPPKHTILLPMGEDIARGTDEQNKQSPSLEWDMQHGNIPILEWENPNFIPYCSEQSSICCSPDGERKALLSSNTETSSDSVSLQDTLLPKMGEENCGCRLSYANCFSGLDAEVDDENIDSEPSMSSLPMTTPPSSGSLRSVDMNLFDLSDGRKDPYSPMSSVENFISSQYQFESLGRLEDRPFKMSGDFGQLQDHLADLQKMFETYSGSTLKHPGDKCTVHFSEDRHALCVASRHLMSSCQKVISVGQTPKQIQNALNCTFQNLIDLTKVCLQFTSCDHCNRRQIAVLTNLKDVVCTYHQFVQAARKACEKDCSDMSIKLLSRQCTALTAATFCLTQQFRTLTSI